MAIQSGTTNKVFFKYKDSNDKEVVISLKHIDSFSLSLEQACRNIAISYYNNRSCLKLDLSGGLRKVEFETVNMQILYSLKNDIGSLN